jgi:hypothetical protein
MTKNTGWRASIEARDERIIAHHKSGKSRAEIFKAMTDEGYTLTLYALDNRVSKFRKTGRLPEYVQPVPDYALYPAQRNEAGKLVRCKADVEFDRRIAQYVANKTPHRDIAAALAAEGAPRSIKAIEAVIKRLRLSGDIPPPAKIVARMKRVKLHDEDVEPQVFTEAVRRCLGGCSSMFLSFGPGNRICDNCLDRTAFICAGVDHRFVGSGL